MAGNAIIGALRVVLGADSAELETGLKKASQSLQHFGASVANAGKIAAASFAAVGIGIAVAIKGAINEADKLGKMAQSVGIPVEDLSRLKHAADLSGVSIESLAKSVGKLSKNMMEAATNSTGDAAQAFAAVGVSVRGTDGSLKNSSQVITELAGKFAQMKDGAGKTALAMAIFGRSGAELIPMLNQGAQGMRDMLTEADELGLVIDGKTARAAEAFNDNLTRMGKITGGIVQKVTAEMLPAFLQFSQVLLDVAKNQDMMKAAADGLTSFLRGAVEVVLTLAVTFKRLGAEIAAVWEMLKLFGQGEFSKGLEVFQNAGKETEAAFANMRGFIQKFYQDAEATAAAQGPRVAQTIAAPFVAGTKAAKDALEKFLASTVKRQAGLEAEAQTIGLSVGAHERLKTILQAEAIAKENNIVITEQMRQKIEQTASSLATTAQRVHDNKVAFQEFNSVAQGVRSSLENAFVDAITRAKSFKDVLRNLIGEFARLGAQSAFRMMFGGASQWQDAAGSMFNSGGIGGLFSGVGKLFGFAEGGSFKVGGAGAIDSQLVAFRASPNEQVSITKPGQMAGAGVVNHYQISADFRGAEASAVASLSLKLDRFAREVPNMALAASRNAVSLNSRALG